MSLQSTTSRRFAWVDTSCYSIYSLGIAGLIHFQYLAVMFKLRLRFMSRAHAVAFLMVIRFWGSAPKLVRNSVFCRLTKYSFVIDGTHIQDIRHYLDHDFGFQLQENINYFINTHIA